MIHNLLVHKIVSNPFYHLAMNIIIVPHGVTDIVHAIHTRNVRNLVKYYGTALLGGEICYWIHQEHIWYNVFFIFSVCHFKHDFDVIVPHKSLSYGLSVLLLLLFSKQSLWVFFAYMLFVHVPHHYCNSWTYVKNYTYITSVLVYVTSVWSNLLLVNSLSNETWMAVLSIVIGHVLYEERVINS
jgi:hypothetical protein